MYCALNNLSSEDRKLRHRIVLFVALLALNACAGYKVGDVAKSDTSMVYDLHRAAASDLVHELTNKLYKRNPSQLPPNMSVEERLRVLFDVPDFSGVKECAGSREITAMQLALSTEFSGDRVFCLMSGLTGMIRNSYNYKTRFYLSDRLDEQKLYRSARNIERLAWRLGHNSGTDGARYLLTNGVDKGAENLSFERLYGKLISQQDMMAQIVADKNKRSINYVVHGLGSMFFIPL